MFTDEYRCKIKQKYSTAVGRSKCIMHTSKCHTQSEPQASSSACHNTAVTTTLLNIIHNSSTFIYSDTCKPPSRSKPCYVLHGHLHVFDSLAIYGTIDNFNSLTKPQNFVIFQQPCLNHISLVDGSCTEIVS